jgi:hypothetical protein
MILSSVVSQFWAYRAIVLIDVQLWTFNTTQLYILHYTFRPIFSGLLPEQEALVLLSKSASWWLTRWACLYSMLACYFQLAHAIIVATWCWPQLDYAENIINLLESQIQNCTAIKSHMCDFSDNLICVPHSLVFDFWHTVRPCGGIIDSFN